MQDSNAIAKDYKITLGIPQSNEIESPLKRYTISKPPRYVIFNNMEEECQDYEDVITIKRTFDELGFHGDSHHDLPYRDILDILEKISYEMEDYGALFVFILTYADRKCNLAASSRNDHYDIYSKLVNDFMQKSGPEIVGKPKVFIIQTYEAPEYDEKEPAHDKDKDEKAVIPQYADLFFGFCSVPGKIKFHDGATFIQTFCEVVSKEYGNYDFETLMTIVRQRRQITGVTPISVSTLRYLLHIDDYALCRQRGNQLMES